MTRPSSLLPPPSFLSKGFTLIELLVVIAILGILAGVLVVSMAGSSDSAKAAKCLSNMKNLAMAVQSRAADTRTYPFAGSVQYMNADASLGKQQMKVMYYERKGWVSWASEGKFPSASKAAAASISLYTDDDDLGHFALTNGALWRYVGGGKSVYVCPEHARRKQHVHWSYLMNAFFGWNAVDGFAYGYRNVGIEYGSTIRYKGRVLGIDRLLLFSEVPFNENGPGDWFPSGESASTDTDGVLQYKDCDQAPYVLGVGKANGNEHIGANHRSGKFWYAHVVFADGHTEKIRCCTSKGEKFDSNAMRELTSYLCTGQGITYTGKKYEKLD